eukprot:653725-Pyramimonas_sp.AAC.1
MGGAAAGVAEAGPVVLHEHRRAPQAVLRARQVPTRPPPAERNTALLGRHARPGRRDRRGSRGTLCGVLSVHHRVRHRRRGPRGGFGRVSRAWGQRGG